MDERNRPGRRNAEHDRERNQVRGMKKKPPILRIGNNSEHGSIEKYEVRGAFRQQTKSEKNGCRNPDEPRRFLLEKKAQPKNNRQAANRHIQPFHLSQPPSF